MPLQVVARAPRMPFDQARAARRIFDKSLDRLPAPASTIPTARHVDGTKKKASLSFSLTVLFS